MAGPFELSRSPYLNDLIQAARQAYEDPHPHHQRLLAEKLKFMADFTELLVRRYAGAMKVRPVTATSRALEPGIRESFEQLKEGLKEVNRWFEDRDREHLARGCSRCREAVAALFESFAELRREEETFPVFSSSPYVNELVRVTLGVASGEFPAEALREKLDWMRERWRRFMEDFREWERAPAENPTVEELLRPTADALSRMGEALAEMERYFADRRREHLKVGCEALLRAAEELGRLQRQLLQAAVPDSVTCPRCALETPTSTRSCQHCGAVLPELPGLSSRTVDVMVGNPSGRRDYAHLVRLEGAVEAALRGEISPQELRPTVEWFARKARNGRRQFEAMKVPSQFPSEEARHTAGRAHQLMEEGTRLVVEGVERLERYFEEPDRTHLDEGMARIREGADRIIEAQELSKPTVAGTG